MITRALQSFARRFVRNDTLGAILSKQIAGIHEAGTYKSERVITSPQSSAISVAEADSDVVCFCANNYLGLSDSKALIKGAKGALDEFGYGMSSVRFICGTQTAHKNLEALLTEFHEAEDTILYSSCFDANAGLFEAILTDEDAVISDSLNHASIIDGVRLCKAQRHRYAHMNMDELETILKNTQNCRLRLIATDGVFSMDGDIAPLDEIVALKNEYNAVLFVDDSHATGFFGNRGRGTPDYFGLNVGTDVDILNSTMGKALGGASGGYTTGRADVVEKLRQASRPYLFSNSLAPPIVGATTTCLEMLMESTELRDKLMENTTLFRSGMKEAGFDIIGHDECPIVPIMLGDARLASEFADEMLETGVYVIGFSYPVVPVGEARIRVQLSAGHSTEEVEHAVAGFIEIGKRKGVID